MDLDEKAKAVLAGLAERIKALSSINADRETLGDRVAGDRYRRWKEATTRFLREWVSDPEARKFSELRSVRRYTRPSAPPWWIEDAERAIAFLRGLSADLKAQPKDVLGAGAERGVIMTEREPTTATRIRLFVSHASADAALAALIIKLVRSALGLPPEAIRCTSVDGYRLPGGADTDEDIRLEVVEADLVLGIISASSLESLYVAFELGARWGTRKNMIPLLAPGVQASAMKAPLGGKNALRADSPGQLQQLVTDVGAALGITPHAPASYQSDMDAILALAQDANQSSAATKARQGGGSGGQALLPTGFTIEHGITWDLRGGVAQPYCEGCRTTDGKLVQMSWAESGASVYSVRTYTCPNGHPRITLDSRHGQRPPMTAAERTLWEGQIAKIVKASKREPS